ncbi:hypothetical protein GQ53DRAFT_105245 [Thozetella sp. PMI_491]|nr:hypothetical protein GQ53DRAFT_105245 [Thozetella sp. PMI_491]
MAVLSFYYYYFLHPFVCGLTWKGALFILSQGVCIRYSDSQRNNVLKHRHGHPLLALCSASCKIRKYAQCPIQLAVFHGNNLVYEGI